MFGPRGVGKSSLLKQMFSSETSIYLDLLKPQLKFEYLKNPERLEKLIQSLPAQIEWVIIDEIQKAPALLDIVHSSIESSPIKFALTWSSSRKLKRNSANLLGGRAFVINLHPFLYSELGKNFNLIEALNWGTLPKIFSLTSVQEKKSYLKSYVSTFVKEEIQEEQIVRKIEPFINFLEVSAQSDTKIINYSNIARDVGVETKTVQSYFQILEDTHIGFKLNPYHESLRKRQNQNPKFYFFDIGVSRALSRTINLPVAPSTFEYGNRFEQFFILQCLALNDYFDKDYKFSYLRTKDNFEIDLVVERPGEKTMCIEIKSSEKMNATDFTNFIKFSKESDRFDYRVASCDTLAFENEKVLFKYWSQVIEELFPEVLKKQE